MTPAVLDQVERALAVFAKEAYARRKDKIKNATCFAPSVLIEAREALAALRAARKEG